MRTALLQGSFENALLGDKFAGTIRNDILTILDKLSLVNIAWLDDGNYFFITIGIETFWSEIPFGIKFL